MSSLSKLRVKTQICLTIFLSHLPVRMEKRFGFRMEKFCGRFKPVECAVLEIQLWITERGWVDKHCLKSFNFFWANLFWQKKDLQSVAGVCRPDAVIIFKLLAWCFFPLLNRFWMMRMMSFCDNFFSWEKSIQVTSVGRIVQNQQQPLRSVKVRLRRQPHEDRHARNGMKTTLPFDVMPNHPLWVGCRDYNSAINSKR